MPFDAVAALRNLKSPVNVSDALGGFAPPEGHSMASGEMASLDAARNMGAEALGAGSAFHALTQALDRNRFAHTTEGLNERDDLASGVPHDIAMQHAGIDADVGDLTSERGAERAFMPFAEQLHTRQMGDILARSDVQYGQPARARAEGDIEAARIGAQGRVQAAGAKDASLPLRGLMDAYNEYITKNGHVPDEATIAAMKALYTGAGTGPAAR